MGYRGRLIFPQIARIYPLDTAAMAASAAPEGYDDIFREPRALPGEGGAVVARTEGDPIDLPCQVEVPRFDAARAMAHGIDMSTLLALVFHYGDLERLGLVEDDTGEAKIRIGDRLEGIYHARTGKLIRRLSQPLFAIQVEDRSFGLTSGERNLLVVTFADRSPGPAGGGGGG